MAKLTKKKLVLTLAVLELATVLFAGRRAARLYAEPLVSQRYVPVESVFPEMGGRQFTSQAKPVVTPALRQQTPEKPDPRVPVVTKVFAQTPKSMM